MSKKIRIGNSSGFWGDEPLAMKRQVEKGQLDYLVADYLAEVSMSVLHKQMQRTPDLGYVPDFVEHLILTGSSFYQSFPKIITNAGGKNPISCAKAVQMTLKQMGFDKKVMAVIGDDLILEINDLILKNTFENIESKESFDLIRGELVVANAYTSSEGIVKALTFGADIVITGRASDSALAIGPLVFEFGWKTDDFDKIACGMITGHILECGSQATGGNFTDWKMVPSWVNMGFPIVTVDENGQIEVSKAEVTGGLVNQWTVKEQLVYEIADPKAYLGPDVIADLSKAQIIDIGKDKVKVSGIKGYKASNTWKVSMAFTDGFKAIGAVVIGGENIKQKADVVQDIFWKRFDFEFEKACTNRIGLDALGNALTSRESNEILLQFVAFDHDIEKLKRFSKEIAGLILTGPQGMAASGGRPKIQEVISYWPTLVNKSDLNMSVFEMLENGEEKLLFVFKPEVRNKEYSYLSKSTEPVHLDYDILKSFESCIQVKMVDLCLARSGDKGNTANIGVLARSESIYRFLKKNLTVEIIKYWFSDLCKGEVEKYSMDGMMALNFVLNEVLDGGGTRSGRLDPQGKMLASGLLAQSIYVPESIIIVK